MEKEIFVLTYDKNGNLIRSGYVSSVEWENETGGMTLEMGYQFVATKLPSGEEQYEDIPYIKLNNVKMPDIVISHLFDHICK